mmetsp:Transcript_28756/g.43452  ORF Transcript_28756/g.43452 Transcript_28756/m.43452 type:complete len:192 (+) Transcript_28756:263-838(+)
MKVALSSYLMEETSHDVENLPFDTFLRKIESSCDTTSKAEESNSHFEFTDALEPTRIRSPDIQEDRRTFRESIREELSEKKNSHQFLDEYSQRVEGNAVMGKGKATTLVDEPYSDIVPYLSISNSNYHQGLESDKIVLDMSSQRQNYFPQQSELQNAKHLEAYSIAMEKLCQTMKRSAMSRTLVKQLSGRS